MASKKVTASYENTSEVLWRCCGKSFEESSAIHKHVANDHAREIYQLTVETLDTMLHQSGSDVSVQESVDDETTDVSSWIPDTSNVSEDDLIK